MPKNPKKARPTDPLVDSYPESPAVQRARIDSLKAKIHIEDPQVAQHTARVILKHNFDFIAATSAMLPKVNERDGAAIAHWLSIAPQVKEALNELYKQIGYDNAAFERYIAILWEWIATGSQRERSDAAKLMGQMFGLGEKAEAANKPMDLPLKNLGEGLKKMGLGDDELAKTKTNPTGFGKIEDEDEEE